MLILKEKFLQMKHKSNLWVLFGEDLWFLLFCYLYHICVYNIGNRCCFPPMMKIPNISLESMSLTWLPAPSNSKCEQNAVAEEGTCPWSTKEAQPCSIVSFSMVFRDNLQPDSGWTIFIHCQRFD